MNVYEMEGFLRGKCMPRDILVNESIAEYLVRKLNEATVVNAERDALYSQEYVSALLADRDAFEGAALALRDELRASQAIANEYQQLMYHMDAGGDFFEFQRDKNNG